MLFIYPYNEILPKKKAHDTFLFQEAAALAKSGASVLFLCGRGSLKREELFNHYGIEEEKNLRLHTLPIIRKNNPLGISWNLPFFLSTQQFLKKGQKAVVVLSVLNQAHYHLKRKVPSLTYLYQAHELAYYPTMSFDPKKLKIEKEVFESADLAIVTTEALKNIVSSPPYSLKIPPLVLPLAVQAKKLKPALSDTPFTLFYVGQLYPEQGLLLLLEALKLVTDVRLGIVGGKESEIASLKEIALLKKIDNRVDFFGFQPPSTLDSLLEKAHAFVAPFQAVSRMPYVAHTKLYAYAEWSRPFIAPDLPAVKKEFPKGVLFFEPNNPFSLARAIGEMKEEAKRLKLQKEIESYSGSFQWEKRAQNLIRLLELNGMLSTIPPFQGRV